MASDADLHVDRRRLKRGLHFWRTLSVVALVALVIITAGRFYGYPDADYVARFTIKGVIVDDSDRRETLGIIRDDDDAKALIVHIDSPGGTVVGGEALYKSLRDVAAKKPVAVVMGQVATSAGYMVALAADRIFAREGTITGSIGVILQTTQVTGLLEKLGITTEAIKSAPLKATPSPFEPLTPKARRATQEIVDDIFDMFVGLVAERRGLTADQAKDVSDGRIYTGRIARTKRLIDAIGGEAEALGWLRREKGISPDLAVRDFNQEHDVDQWLDYLSVLGRKTVFSERLRLDGLISVWHPDLPKT